MKFLLALCSMLYFECLAMQTDFSKIQMVGKIGECYWGSLSDRSVITAKEISAGVVNCKLHLTETKQDYSEQDMPSEWWHILKKCYEDTK